MVHWLGAYASIDRIEFVRRTTRFDVNDLEAETEGDRARMMDACVDE